MPVKRTVFISYSHKDRPLANKLLVWLRELMTVDVIWDEDCLQYGNNVYRELTDAIKGSDYFLILLTHNSLSSNEVAHELGAANMAEKTIIPVVLDGLEKHPDFPKPLSQIKMLCGSKDELDDNQSDLRQELIAFLKEEAILVIGSGLREKVFTDPRVFQVQGDSIRIQSDGKEIIERPLTHYGGSGVNWSIRLAKTGHPILPILSVGPDEIGREIQQFVLSAINPTTTSNAICNFTESDSFLCNDLISAEAPVFSAKHLRIALTPEIEGVKSFEEFVERRLKDIPCKIGTVMLGHIYADAKCNKRISRMILEKFKKSALIYVNFGKSQMSYGIDDWEYDIQNSISVIQMSFAEARFFFQHQIALIQIIKWFWDRKTTAVITLDQVGIVGVFGNNPQRIVCGSSYQLAEGELKDSTGAGDAFGAGVVSILNGDMAFGFEKFVECINTGRVWSAHACKVVGSSINSPSNSELSEFFNKDSLTELEYYEKPTSSALQHKLNFMSTLYERLRIGSRA